MTTKSIKGPRKHKLKPPPKPYPEFPLTPHASGKFQKKVKDLDGTTKILYFGAWAKRVDGVLVPLEDGGWRDAQTAYEAWKRKQDRLERESAALAAKAEQEREQADEHRVAKVEAESTGKLNVVQLCNMFLDFKSQKVKNGELEENTRVQYSYATDLLIDEFGKHKPVEELGPKDFSNLRTRIIKEYKSPDSVTKYMVKVRSIFKYAYEAELIEKIPNYGYDFKRQPERIVKLYRESGGKKLFTRDELLTLLNGGWIKNEHGKRVWLSPSLHLRCAILLGINCGFGNKDVGTVPIKTINLKSKLIRFARSKTGVDRECPLWPETIKAIQDVIAERPETEYENLLVTRYGGPWFQGKTDTAKKVFGRLLKKFGISGRRGLGFYSLRHTFDTIGMEVNDRDAVKSLMGHTDLEMVARYNHAQVPLARRQAVVNHVRKWLFGKGPKKR